MSHGTLEVTAVYFLAHLFRGVSGGVMSAGQGLTAAQAKFPGA
jgi:hypothetical protein